MILELVERLAGEATKAGLDFLVIGGHAVVHHGYSRMTFDVDFLSRDSQRAGWLELLEKFHYAPYTDTAAFVQFSSRTVAWPLVDLMFVQDETWTKLRSEAVAKKHGRLEIFIPDVKHLIFLKLHAALSPTRSLPAKDWGDIEELLVRHRLDPADPEFSEMIRKHGGEESLARLRKVWQDYLQREQSWNQSQ